MDKWYKNFSTWFGLLHSKASHSGPKPEPGQTGTKDDEVPVVLEFKTGYTGINELKTHIKEHYYWKKGVLILTTV